MGKLTGAKPRKSGVFNISLDSTTSVQSEAVAGVFNQKGQLIHVVPCDSLELAKYMAEPAKYAIRSLTLNRQ